MLLPPSVSLSACVRPGTLSDSLCQEKKFLCLPLSARETQRRATVRKAYSDEQFGRFKRLCARFLVREVDVRLGLAHRLPSEVRKLCAASQVQGFMHSLRRGNPPVRILKWRGGPRPSLMSFLKTNAYRVGPLNDSDIYDLVSMGK